MALIDTTDLLVDPDFVNALSLIHRTPTVDNYGQLQLSSVTVNTIGSVQPITGKALQRVPESLRVADVRSFWIRGDIIADGSSQYPDLISYGGQSYAIQITFPWTNWGAGWTEGVCVRQVPSA